MKERENIQNLSLQERAELILVIEGGNQVEYASKEGMSLPLSLSILYLIRSLRVKMFFEITT